MPTEEELIEKMAEIRKLYSQVFEKMKQFETNRNLKWENELLLKALIEEHRTSENLRMVMDSFFYNYKSFFVAR